MSSNKHEKGKTRLHSFLLTNDDHLMTIETSYVFKNFKKVKLFSYIFIIRLKTKSNCMFLTIMALFFNLSRFPGCLSRPLIKLPGYDIAWNNNNRLTRI